ncbi:MAG: hypothetical protein JO015_10015 [Verrucomicrobia bacterium]|nr:hypothetical protein [Verrucomicrobiota bacterium]
MEHPEALVTSVHNYNEPTVSGETGKTRIDLRWEGPHEIGDFELERLGNVLNNETETEHTGWVEVVYPGNAKTGDVIPLRKSS